MELGSLVWFSSREHPFAVRERHCLDLECSCTDGWLTFTEVNLAGQELREPLTFEIRVNLRNGRERWPPRRSAEIQALVREFLVRFPAERFQEMVTRHHEQRTARRQLAEYMAEPSSRGELLSYSDVIYAEGGLAKNGRRYGFFFTHDGRDYLIEDQYCPNPACDCRKVHIEFWERIESSGRTPKIELRQHLMAAFTLDGQLAEIAFCDKDRRGGASIARAWREHWGDRFDIFRERYEQIKAIGRRSMPSDEPAPRRSNAAEQVRQEPREASPATSRAGRNDPCPCGSGRKFKRCCGRR